MQTFELADERMTVRSTALMVDGKAFTPARLAVRTQGDVFTLVALAPSLELAVRRPSLGGTVTPMKKQ